MRSWPKTLLTLARMSAAKKTASPCSAPVFSVMVASSDSERNLAMGDLISPSA